MQKPLTAFQAAIACTNTMLIAALVTTSVSLAAGSSVGQTAGSLAVSAAASLVLSIFNVHIMLKRARETGIVGAQATEAARAHPAEWVAGMALPLAMPAAIALATPKLF